MQCPPMVGSGERIVCGMPFLPNGFPHSHYLNEAVIKENIRFFRKKSFELFKNSKSY